MQFREEAERIVWRMYEDLREEEVNSAIKSLQAAYERGRQDERERCALIAEETEKFFLLAVKAVESIRNVK